MGWESSPANGWAAGNKTGSFKETEPNEGQHACSWISESHLWSPRPSAQTRNPGEAPITRPSKAPGNGSFSGNSTSPHLLPHNGHHHATPPLCFIIDFTTSEEFLMGKRA